MHNLLKNLLRKLKEKNSRRGDEKKIRIITKIRKIIWRRKKRNVKWRVKIIKLLKWVWRKLFE